MKVWGEDCEGSTPSTLKLSHRGYRDGTGAQPGGTGGGKKGAVAGVKEGRCGQRSVKVCGVENVTVQVSAIARQSSIKPKIQV